jgi:hypothetical protein
MMDLTRWLLAWMIRPVVRGAAITAWPSSIECTMGCLQYTSFPAFIESMEACVPAVRRSHNDGVDVLAHRQFATIRRQSPPSLIAPT